MRYSIPILCTLLILFCSTLPAQAGVPSYDDILAEAAVLMDADTGQVLYEKNMHQQRQPASITKILTGLLALEYLEEDTVITASATAVNIPSWGSSAYIQAGERLTVEQAMYAMMLKSANEAANVLGEAAAGSLAGFIRLMNERAEELGAQGSYFANTNGLPARNHYTTAYDMALITRQAIRTPGFLTYFGADTYSMPGTNKSGGRFFTNTHRMLVEGYAAYNREVIGGKTGYTMPAGYTLATVAQRDGRTLICVVLKSGNYYEDTQVLLEFGFEEFTAYTYHFAGNEIARTSIWDDDWESGRAYFYEPDSVALLLHNSVDPANIHPVYRYPDRLEQWEEIAGSVTLEVQADGQGLPASLITLPMTVEVATFEPSGAEAMMVMLPEEPENKRGLTVATALGMILLGCTGVMLVLYGRRRWELLYRRMRRTRRFRAGI